jgi:hypothetical protein
MFLLFLRLESVHALLKILSLALILLLDLIVHLLRFELLILDVCEEMFLDFALEILVVVDALDDPVDGVLKRPNVDLVRSDLGASGHDKFLLYVLPDAEVIDDVAKVGVGLVVLAKRLVHGVCLALKTRDFLLTGCNVALELLDLVVEHELELLELLRLLLQDVDLAFALTNGLVLVVNLFQQSLNFAFLLISCFFLVLYLSVLILYLTLQLSDLLLHVA